MVSIIVAIITAISLIINTVITNKTNKKVETITELKEFFNVYEQIF